MGKNFKLDEYVPVHERVEKFYSKHPEGRITTSILEHNAETGFVLMRADVFREQDDALPAATGHAYELRSSGYVQQGSYVEVCETSAVGRALALLGFEVRRGIASREEMEKVSRMEASAGAGERAGAAAAREARPAPKSAEAGAAGAEGATKAEAATKAAARGEAKGEARPAAAKGAAEPTDDLDSEILKAAAALGYDAPKVRKWVNQRFEVTGGLDSLTTHDKREILKIFRERAPASAPPPAKTAQR